MVEVVAWFVFFFVRFFGLGFGCLSRVRSLGMGRDGGWWGGFGRGVVEERD